MIETNISVIVAIILLMLSCVFSGLTLGFLSLDPVSLEIVARGDTAKATYAQMILPIREQGNRLLCTLLLGNVAVNSGLTILLVNLIGGWPAFGVSTATILIFGEIIPRSLCGRYALYIASKVTVPVSLLGYLMCPIVWPVSKFLDEAVGQDLGLVYTNRELQNLVNIHEAKGSLPSISAGIMQGALDFSKLTAERVMTQWKDVFFLRSDALLDFITLEKIFKSGHSRVPILNSRTTQLEQVDSVCPVIGLLFVKDLILLDPEDELPVQYIIDNFRHDLKNVDINNSVDRILEDFRHGRSHLAIVQKRSENMVNGVHIYENVGIITLEDILENILKMDITDEFDQNVAEPRRNNEALRFFDYRRVRGMDSLPPQERIVVYRHLCKEVKVFTTEYRRAEELDLQKLLASATIWKIVLDVSDTDTEGYEYKNRAMVEDGGHVLYRKGLQSEFFTFILDGKAEVFSGRQMFRTEVSRFAILFPELLTRTQTDYAQGFELSDFVPDFTARVIQSSRILRISRLNFLKCLQGKLKNYSRPANGMKEEINVPTQRSKYLQVHASEMNFEHRLCESENIESWRGLNTVAPGARKLIKTDSPWKASKMTKKTGYINQVRGNSNMKLTVSSAPQTWSVTPTHKIKDIGNTGDEFISIDMVKLHSAPHERVSSDFDKSTIDGVGMISPALERVMLVPDANSNRDGLPN